MSYNARMMFAEAEKDGVPKGLSEKVWNAMGVYADECLRMGKGVKIPQLGSVNLSRQNVKNSTGGGGARRSVFVISNKFAKSYGIQQKKIGYDMLAPCLEFNASRVAYKCNTDKDTVMGTLHILIRVLGKNIASGQSCRIMLEPLGSLISQRRDVFFKFSTSEMALTQTLNQTISNSNNDQTQYKDSVNSEGPSLLELAAKLPVPPANTISSSRRTSSRRVTPPQPEYHASSETATSDMVLKSSSSNQYKSNPALETAFSPVSTQGAKYSGYNGPDIVSVFPRFTPVESLDKLNARHSSAAVSTNLANAFVRVEEKLAKETDAIAREAKHHEMRRKRTKQLFLERRQRDTQKRDELVCFLAEQSQEAKSRREAERNDFLSTEGMNPGCTYPLGSPVDPATEHRIKQSLKAALDEQVSIRSNYDKNNKSDEKAMDDFLLKCVRAEQRSDYIAERTRRGAQRGTLTSSWEQQRDLARRAKDVLATIS